MNKKILFIVLNRCVYLLKCPFWKKLLEYLSYGVSPDPTRLYINADQLIYKDDTHLLSCAIDSENIETTCNNIVKLLCETDIIPIHKKINCIYSEKKDLDFTEPETSWANIRKKTIKNCMIDMFVLNAMDAYNLNVTQAKSLLNKIKSAITFKRLTNDDILIEQNNIIFIHGLTFADNKFEFVFDLTNIQGYSDDNTISLSSCKNNNNIWQDKLHEITNAKKRYSQMLF